jgi:hypothetical protein
MAAQAQRIADLERQMAELRAEVMAAAAGLEHVFEAGRASVFGPTRDQPRTSHLRLIPGGLDAPEAEVGPELEAGA